jgi:hypothetical protein
MILSASVPAFAEPSGFNRVRCTPRIANSPIAMTPGLEFDREPKKAAIMAAGY